MIMRATEARLCTRSGGSRAQQRKYARDQVKHYTITLWASSRQRVWCVRARESSRKRLGLGKERNCPHRVAHVPLRHFVHWLILTTNEVLFIYFVRLAHLSMSFSSIVKALVLFTVAVTAIVLIELRRPRNLKLRLSHVPNNAQANRNSSRKSYGDVAKAPVEPTKRITPLRPKEVACPVEPPGLGLNESSHTRARARTIDSFTHCSR